MLRFLLRERARALAAGLATGGLAVMAPAGLNGFGAFLRSPPGLGVKLVTLVVREDGAAYAMASRRITAGWSAREATEVIIPQVRRGTTS